MTKSEHQPRDHSVPCQDCGLRLSGRRATPATMTFNNSALCDRHERERERECVIYVRGGDHAQNIYAVL